MTPKEIKTLEDALEFHMPWGDHKGTLLENLPDYYLRWLATDCKNDTIASYADVIVRWRDST